MMKKIIFISTLFASNLAFANTVNSSDQAEQQPSVQYRFGVFNVQSGTATPLQSNNTISRTNPNHKLCWSFISDTPFIEQTVATKESITSPAGGSFTDDKSVVQSSIDGTHHVIHSTMIPVGGSIVERCWQFDSNDQLGKYTLTTQISDKVMPTQEFTVVE